MGAYLVSCTGTVDYVEFCFNGETYKIPKSDILNVYDIVRLPEHNRLLDISLSPEGRVFVREITPREYRQAVHSGNVYVVHNALIVSA